MVGAVDYVHPRFQQFGSVTARAAADREWHGLHMHSADWGLFGLHKQLQRAAAVADLGESTRMSTTPSIGYCISCSGSYIE